MKRTTWTLLLLGGLAGCGGGGGPVEGDLSCLGEGATPAPGEVSTHTFTVKDGPFEMSTTVDVALHGKRTKIDLSDHW